MSELEYIGKFLLYSGSVSIGGNGAVSVFKWLKLGDWSDWPDFSVSTIVDLTVVIFFGIEITEFILNPFYKMDWKNKKIKERAMKKAKEKEEEKADKARKKAEEKRVERVQKILADRGLELKRIEEKPVERGKK